MYNWIRLTIRGFLLGHVVGGFGRVVRHVGGGSRGECIGLRAIGARPAVVADAFVQV